MGSGASVMHSFTAAGTYDVVVTCSDGADSAMATAQVVVTGNTIVPDAGEPDAGATADAGETPDSGQVTPLPDAGSMADAGHDNMTSTGTCGCGSAGFAPGLLALVALVRRRRFPRRAPLR
jgi:hypothetical protein